MSLGHLNVPRLVVSVQLLSGQHRHTLSKRGEGERVKPHDEGSHLGEGPSLRSSLTAQAELLAD
jgi:hypothetical protein